MGVSAEELDALLNSPAMEPPNGTTADFDNPPNRNGLAWFVTTFCMAIATVCMILRAYSRMWKAKAVKLEEVLMVCAYGAYWATAYAGYSLIFTPGYYVHQWNLYYKDLIKPLYFILIYGSAYSVVMPCIKSAILLDWCTVLVPDRHRNFFWWACMAVVGLQAVWGFACVVLLNMQCTPHESIWLFYLQTRCYSLPDVMLTSASVQVLTDFAMVLLPQKVIWGLNMNWQRKTGIAVIFGVGILACIAACVRLSTTITFSKTQDQMYYIGPLLFWACAEMTCGFFILCVPCVPKLISESGVLDRFGSRGRACKDDNDDSCSRSSWLRSPSLSRHEGSGKPGRVALTVAADSGSPDYYKMDGVHGGTTEARRAGAGVRVTRTTRVVVSDSGSRAD